MGRSDNHPHWAAGGQYFAIQFHPSCVSFTHSAISHLHPNLTLVVLLQPARLTVALTMFARPSIPFFLVACLLLASTASAARQLGSRGLLQCEWGS